MEASALVYIVLLLVTVGLALVIRNRDYVPLRLKKGYGPGEYRPVNREQARNVVAEFAIYCLLAGVSACRIAVGNDYWVYRFNFRLIAQERHVSSEFGFNLIVRWLTDLFGYDNYLPIFGFYSLLTVLFFSLALHAQATEYAFAVFLLLTGGYYYNSLNSVRYYLALAIALFAMKYVLRGEYGKFLLWILFGMIFHKSVLLVVPVYLTAHYLSGTKWKTWHSLVLGGFLLSLLFGQKFYRFVIFKIYPFYENTGFDNGRISYVNVAKCLCTLGLFALVCFLQMGRESDPLKDRPTRFYFFLNVFGLIAFLCGSFVPEVTRIGYYMIVSQVFLLPRLIYSMEKGWVRTLCKGCVILGFSVYFALLLKEMYRTDIRLLPYLNWIFQ